MSSVRALVALVLVVACAACSSSGGDASQSATTKSTTTTVELTPEQAFDASLEEQLTVTDPRTIPAYRRAGVAFCEMLTALAAGIANDDAPNDTPETDEGISNVVVSAAIAAAYDDLTETNEAVGVVVLRATGEHLCPEHTMSIERVLIARGH